MATERFNNQPRKTFIPRPMIKGSWSCKDCGTEITELPFEPKAERPVYCRDCWAKRRKERFAG